MLKTIRLILINLLIGLLLLIFINWLCGVLYRSKAFGQSRSSLPIYTESDSIGQVTRDYSRSGGRYMPYMGWEMKPMSTQTTNVNADGTRVFKPIKPVPENAPSVYFFGGSTMWGQFSSDQHTIPALFQQYQPAYRAVNQGQIAYTSHQSLVRLIRLYYLGHHPDYVVFYDGVNDGTMSCEPERDPPGHWKTQKFAQRIDEPYNTILKEISSEVFVGNIIRLIGKVEEQNELVALDADIELKTTPYGFDCCDKPDKLDLVTDGIIHNWQMAKDLVEARGGTFIAILQPVGLYGNPDVSYLDYGMDKVSLFNYAHRKTYEAFYDMLRKKIQERKLDWIYDMSDAFDGQRVYVDRYHVLPAGNEIIARRISGIFDQMEAREDSLANNASAQ